MPLLRESVNLIEDLRNKLFLSNNSSIIDNITDENEIITALKLLRSGKSKACTRSDLSAVTHNYRFSGITYNPSSSMLGQTNKTIDLRKELIKLYLARNATLRYSALRRNLLQFYLLPAFIISEIFALLTFILLSLPLPVAIIASIFSSIKPRSGTIDNNKLFTDECFIDVQKFYECGYFELGAYQLLATFKGVFRLQTISNPFSWETPWRRLAWGFILALKIFSSIVGSLAAFALFLPVAIIIAPILIPERLHSELKSGRERKKTLKQLDDLIETHENKLINATALPSKAQANQIAVLAQVNQDFALPIEILRNEIIPRLVIDSHVTDPGIGVGKVAAAHQFFDYFETFRSNRALSEDHPDKKLHPAAPTIAP